MSRVRIGGLVGAVVGVALTAGTARADDPPSSGWWDTNADYVGDVFIGYAVNDGTPDVIAFDQDRNGQVESIAVDFDNNGYVEAFVEDRSGNGVWDTFTVDPDQTGSWQVIPDDNEDLQPDWLPSGTSTPGVDYSMNIATVTSTLLPTVYENL